MRSRWWISCVGLIGCADHTEPWWAQLTSDAPCHRVNLLDGFDETSPDELHSAFACLNSQEQLGAFKGMDELLDVGNNGQIVARVLNRTTAWDLSRSYQHALDVSPHALHDASSVWLELVYGQPRSTIESPDFNLYTPGAAGLGVLSPAVLSLAQSAPLWPLDLPPALWGESVEDIPEDPRFEPPLRALLPAIGAALTQTRVSTNDRWEGSTGNSARDLLRAVLTDNRHTSFSADLEVLLRGASTRRELADTIERLVGEGTLHDLFTELSWLTAVNAAGEPLSAGETPALQAIVRFLSDGNTELVCTVELGGHPIPLQLGNLSVGVTRWLVDLPPDDLLSSLQGLSGLPGASQALLHQIAAEGTCPPLDQAMLSDLQAVRLLAQTPAVLSTFVEISRVFQHADRGEEWVNLFDSAHTDGIIPPVEELIADLSHTDLIPMLLDLSAVPVDSTENTPLLWVLERGYALTRSRTDGSIVEKLTPFARSINQNDRSWLAIDRLSTLLQQPTSVTSDATRLLRVYRALTPQSPTDPDTAHAFRELLESEDLVQAALAATPLNAERTPLQATSTWLLDGTIEEVLRMFSSLGNGR